MKQLERHEDDIASAAAVLKAARYRSKAQFEKRFHKVLNYDFYNPGDLVIIRNSKDEMTLGKKTMKRYLGPFEVDRRTRNGAYVIKELDGTYIRTSVAAFRLYPYLDRKSPLIEQLSPKNDTFLDDHSDSGDEDWEY
ncbi:hypothetical protein FIBSPDRAFT_952444 [Athelia psychrophila]|uniref:Integrase zinc-binding domain-containing protein n=1 Tax=Athelia psychrophila TaxID=1759441 RepID=A0A166LEH1_9AGAM|nr:hypothetical protein FIBSPDRAFT_952444 [Fibularhizoctonia sp. CBS 109695]